MITQSDYGKLLLRLMLGGLMLFHGVAKISGGIAFISMKVTEAGLPQFLAYGVYIGEIVAPILIIIGLKTRFASLIMGLTMVFAIYLVHANEIFALSKGGAWAIELLMMYVLGSICIMLLGAGRLSFDKK